MSLPHILLGLLRSPAAGYDLHQQIGEYFSHFWAADLPQIYRTLNRLERDGLLSATTHPSERGPDRRVYALTSTGVSALTDWLTTPPEPEVERIGSLARTCFLGALDSPGAALAPLQRLRRQFEEQLEALQSLARSWAASDPSYPDCDQVEDFYLQLTLDARIHELMARAAWASRSIRRVEDRARRQASGRAHAEPRRAEGAAEESPPRVGE